MSRATFERQEIERFNRYWEDLFEEMPEARRKAIEEMGKAVEKELHTRIRQSNLEADAMGTVISWQELRLGSGGGYAAITPRKASSYHSGRKPKTWKGEMVTVKQITKWLERGHGTRNKGGLGYVKGRQFYSFTKLYAWKRAKEAAEQVLEQIADG